MCRDHNIAYLKNCDLKSRYKVDKILENCSWKKVFLGNNLKEKSKNYVVINAMKVKQKWVWDFKRTVIKRKNILKKIDKE